MNTNSETEDDEDTEDDGLDISNQAIGLIAAALALPVDIYITHHGGVGRGRAAFIFVAATSLTVMNNWKSKKYWWFWMTVVVISFIECYLFQRIHWYEGSLPAVSLLPIALLLTLLQFGCVTLVKKMMLKSKIADPR